MARGPGVGHVGRDLVDRSRPGAGTFPLNLNVRVIHVEHLEDGLRIYLRLPMPYLVADRLGATGPDGLPKPAPYTTNRMEDGRLVHYLDADALRADPNGLGQLVAEGHPITVNGQPLAVEVEQTRAYPGTNQPSSLPSGTPGPLSKDRSIPRHIP